MYQNPSVPDRMPERVSRLIERVQNDEQMTPAKAHRYLLESEIRAEDVAPWAEFQHRQHESYGRRQVYKGDGFKLMVMSWAPGDLSAIHGHAWVPWGAVKAFGRCEHSLFEFNDGHLKMVRCRPFAKGEVAAVDCGLIHQMGNRDQPPFCSVHLYGTAPVNGHGGHATRVFDLFRNEVVYTQGGAFFCLDPDCVERRESGLTADFATRTRHHVAMLDRIRRFLPQQPENCKWRRVAQQLETRLFNKRCIDELSRELMALTQGDGTVGDPEKWNALWREAHYAAQYKAELSACD